VTWYGEYYVYDENLAYPVDMTKARGKERNERAKQKLPDRATPVRLPYQVNGRHAYYYAMVSRIRLPLDAIEQLTLRIDDLLPAMDVAPAGQNGLFFSPKLKKYVLRVVDPITIAINMNRQYQRARDGLLAFMTVYKGQSTDSRKAVIERQQLKLMAQLLVGVLDHDRDDDLDMRDDFGTAKERQMRNYLLDYDKQVTWRSKSADRLAASLCYWLKGELIGIVETSYRIFEKDDYHRFITFRAEMIGRLQECAPGRALLSSLMKNDDYLTRQYILRTSAPDDLRFQVGRKSAAAIIKVWSEMAALYFKTHGPRDGRVVIESLNHIAGFRMVVIGETRKSVRVLRREEFVSIQLTPEALRVNTDTAAWADWIQDGHSVGELIGVASKVVEVVNLAWSLKELVDADPDESTPLNVIGTVGSLADTVDAFGVVLRISERPLAAIGLVSAVIDTICGVADANDMAKRNDYSAMVGYGVVATGSALIGLGSAMVLAGVAASSTIAGLPLSMAIAVAGAILVAAGWVIAVFTADSDIELFVSHCYWGDSYGDGSDKTKWGLVPFRAWQGNLDVQIKALFNIVAGFAVRSTASTYTEVAIASGMLQPNSKVHVNFECGYPLGVVHEPKLVIDMSTRKMKQLGGEPADLSKFSIGDGYVTVDAKFRDPPTAIGKSGERKPLILQNQYTRCEVYLDLHGDGKYRIPSSGAWVKHDVFELGSMIDSDPTYSKDF
jgi:hypothetical protein